MVRERLWEVHLPGLQASTARRTGWWAALPPLALLALVLIGTTIAYSMRRTVDVDVGSTYGRAFLVDFHANERFGAVTVAQSTTGSAIRLPGVGSSPSVLTLAMIGARPPGFDQPVVTLRTGGISIRFRLDDPNLRTYRMLVPATAGDLYVDLDTNTFVPSDADPRVLGVPVEYVQVSQAGGGPPLTTLALLGALALLLWVFGLRVGLSPWLAALLALVPLLPALAGLALARTFITIGLERWVWLLLLLHLGLWPLQALTRAVLQRHALEVRSHTWNWLWGIVGVTFLYKLGGALYPHIIVFDEWAHSLRVQWVLDGQFWERLYQPGYTSFMGATVGLEDGYFPYSPLWYLVIAPLRWLGLDAGDAMNGLSTFLDVTKALMVFLIGLATMRRERAALLASALYGLLPMPYFMTSWGNYPTQFGLWAALLATTFLVLNYSRLTRPRTFGWWAAAMALALLTYTVIGIFMAVMVAFLAGLELVRHWRGDRRFLLALVGGVAAAELFALAIYHYQFVGPIVVTTLPTVISNLVENKTAELRTDVDMRESPLANWYSNNAFLVNHTTWPLLIAAGAGLVWLFVDRETRRWWRLWLAWFLIFVVFSYVSAFIADMVRKHMFFMMPLLVLAAALALDQLWQRWRYARWAVLAGMLWLAAFTTERFAFYLLVKRHVE